MNQLYCISIPFLILGLLGTFNVTFTQEYNNIVPNNVLNHGPNVISHEYHSKVKCKGGGGGRGGGGSRGPSRSYGGSITGIGSETSTSEVSIPGWLSLITWIILLIPLLLFLRFLYPNIFNPFKKS